MKITFKCRTVYPERKIKMVKKTINNLFKRLERNDINRVKASFLKAFMRASLVLNTKRIQLLNYIAAGWLDNINHGVDKEFKIIGV